MATSLPETSESGAVQLPTEREFPFDPPRVLGELRNGQPLKPLRYLDGHVGWLVTGHELARAAGSELEAAREAVTL